MTDSIASAIKNICDEKGLSYDAVLSTIESALAAAYRKDYGKKNQNIIVEFSPENGKTKVYDHKIVVEDLPPEVEASEEGEGEEKEEYIEKEKAVDENGEEIEERKFNPKTEIQLSEAKILKKTAKIGDEIKIKLEVPTGYGRMAAQTAKQVIIQKLREAEREMVFNDFKEKEHEVVSGIIQRREGSVILVDLGKSIGVLPHDEQIPGEKYMPGERIKVYVKEVNLKTKGPEILLSRVSDEILKKVFYLEIPEISNGLIELKAVAREAGFRSKVAVWTDSDNVDPIGSCVGQRGARIQTIIAELGGEKVDIIEYDENPEKFISNALSPAKIINIETDEEKGKAKVMVSEDQLSLAIGKGGQNARLAAKLTGWKIDIVHMDTEKTVTEADKDSVIVKMGEEAEETKEEKESDKNVDEVKEEKEEGREDSMENNENGEENPDETKKS
jgi:transcription termination/antitermination protein NusA